MSDNSFDDPYAAHDDAVLTIYKDFLSKPGVAFFRPSHSVASSEGSFPKKHFNVQSRADVNV